MAVLEQNIDSIFHYSIKKGVLLGVGICTLVLLVYIIDYSYLVHWSLSLILIALITTIVCSFGLSYRKWIGGYLGFAQSFQLTSTIFLTSYVVQLIFNILLYSVIDPELSVLMTDSIIENSESLFRSMGMSQDDIDLQILRLEKEIPIQFQTLSQLKNSWIMVVTSLIFGLIAAVIIKKEEPIIK